MKTDTYTGTSILFFIVMASLIVITLDGIKVETKSATTVEQARVLQRECKAKHKSAKIKTIWKDKVPVRWDVSCGSG